jgi:F0F1-type ATP synthase delta subunit
LRPAAQLFVASEAGTKQHQEAIKVAKATLDAPDPVPVVVDETLIGGFILEANGQRLNHSYHEQLRRLYQKISG